MEVMRNIIIGVVTACVVVIGLIFLYQFIAGANTDSVPDIVMLIVDNLGLFIALGAMVGIIFAVLVGALSKRSGM